MDAKEQNNKSFELYAVQYGTSLFPSATVYNGDTSGKKLPFAWLFFVVKISGRIVLIDTGFSDHKKAIEYGVTMTETKSQLESIGVTSKSVTDIIITHAHFDHTGGIDAYPSAKIYASLHEQNKLALYCHDMSRVTFFEKTYTLDPSISVECIAGHTVGSSVVWLDDGKTRIVLTGDEAYLPGNYEKVIPNGSVYNPEANRAFLKKVHDLHITAYTFHDPAIVKNGSVIQKLYPSLLRH